MSTLHLTRAQVLRHRARVQELDRAAGTRDVTDPAVLDLGVQDSGTGGALWALANRGARVAADGWPDDLALVWTVRGSPQAYRRDDLPHVESALRPYSPADAAKRILNANAPLAAAGIPADEALVTVAGHLRELVTGPTVKGEASGRLSAAVGEPYLKRCVPCGATHVYELPFRLAALHAGLEIEPDTSPPVLRRIPSWPAGHLGSIAHDRAYPPRLDPVRGYLHALGPARPADVASYLDASPADVRRRWPADVVEVSVDGQRRWALAADEAALVAAASEPDGRGASGGGGAPRGDGDHAPVVRLLGPFDPFVQARDHATIVPDAAARKALWPAIGRPGAVLVDGEIVGTWRPRAAGTVLRLRVDRWVPWTRDVEGLVGEQAERLAAHRGATLAGLETG